MRKIKYCYKTSSLREKHTLIIGDFKYEILKFRIAGTNVKVIEKFYINTVPETDISEAYLKIIRPKTHLFFKRIKYKVLKEYL